MSINGQTQRDKRTVTNTIHFRINQELKFLYRKKQHLNQQLYRAHLEGSYQYNGMWQHIQNIIDEQTNRLMEKQYQKLNKKLHGLS
jgi:hypothetical protein